MILKCKVHPNSKQEKLVYKPDWIEVWIKSPASDGKANKNLIEFLSKTLDISKSLINISKGSYNKLKKVEIDLVESELILKLLKI